MVISLIRCLDGRVLPESIEELYSTRSIEIVFTRGTEFPLRSQDAFDVLDEVVVVLASKLGPNDTRLVPTHFYQYVPGLFDN